MLQLRQVIVPVFAVLVAIAGTTASHAQQGAAEASEVAGTVVRFSAGSTSVDLTIGEDNPTVRDFLSMLPLTMTPEEYADVRRSGISTAGLRRKDPLAPIQDGELIYFIPWGNISFYYNTAGVGFSNQCVHIGTYDASLETLGQLKGQPVRVERVQ